MYLSATSPPISSIIIVKGSHHIPPVLLHRRVHCSSRQCNLFVCFASIALFWHSPVCWPIACVQDVPLFNGIISDLFPGVELPKPDYGVFMEALKDNIAKRELQPVPWFLEKIIQVGFLILSVMLSVSTISIVYVGGDCCLCWWTFCH